MQPIKSNKLVTAATQRADKKPTGNVSLILAKASSMRIVVSRYLNFFKIST